MFKNINLKTEEKLESTHEILEKHGIMRKNNNIIGDNIPQKVAQPNEPYYIPERIYPKTDIEYIPDLNLAPDLVEFRISEEELQKMQENADEHYTYMEKMQEHSDKVRRDGIIDAMMFMVDLQDSHSKEPQPHFPHLKVICGTCMKIFRILPTLREDYEIIQADLEDECPWCKGVMERVIRPVMELTE